MKGFKSEAQKNHFKKLVKDGKMTQEIFDAIEKDTPNHKKLPTRIHPKKKDQK